MYKGIPSCYGNFFDEIKTQGMNLDDGWYFIDITSLKKQNQISKDDFQIGADLNTQIEVWLFWYKAQNIDETTPEKVIFLLLNKKYYC